MNGRQTTEQPAAGSPRPPAASPDAPRAEGASAFWAGLREYRRLRERWEADIHRLMQARRELEARHWQLLLDAAELVAKGEERQAIVLPLPPPVGEGLRFDERLALFEKSLLAAGLARTGGCRRQAAALLGLLPSTLCEKLKRLGMTVRTGGDAAAA